MGSQANVQTLLVGIDAACYPVLGPLFESGDVPALASLFDSGVSGPLESQIPPWTASAWPSLYTGMNPGKHGVFSFLAFDGYEWDVVNATHVRERTLWELLSRERLTSVVVNAPVTHPPRTFDGALVPGYTAPEDPTCHPDGLLSDVREAVGTYRVYPSSDEGRPAADAYRECVRSRGEAFRYLVDRFDPAFGFLQFQATDTVFHERPGDRETVREVYREVDLQVERAIEACDPDTIVVASDHGIGPYGGYEFRVNDFLREEGFVDTVRGGTGMPSWSARWERGRPEGSGGRVREVAERAMGYAASAGVTSQRIGAVLERLNLADFVAEHVPSALIRAGTTQVNFPDSRAYMRSRIELGVRLNVAGREPNGTVPRSEYETVRASVADALRSVTTPDGRPVFDEVAPREEYFHGPEAHRAVDVVTVPADFDHFLTASLRGERFGSPSEPWNHKLDGMFAVVGDGVDHDVSVAGAHLFDVAPTVLATLGVARDERMDGRVLPCVEPAGTRSYPRLDADSTVRTDDHEVADRLSDLGYLE